MNEIASMRNSIVAGLQPLVPAHVAPFGGRLNLEALRVLGKRTPAVVVAALGVPSIDERGGNVSNDVRWAAYIVTTDRPGMGRDEQALVLVRAVLGAVARTDWGLALAHRATDITADNLYTRAIDALGVALWAVSWRQRLELPPLTEAELRAFKRFYGDSAVADGLPSTAVLPANIEVPQ